MTENRQIYCTFNNSDREIIVDAPPGYGDVKPFFGSKLADGKLYLEPYGTEFLVKY